MFLCLAFAITNYSRRRSNPSLLDARQPTDCRRYSAHNANRTSLDLAALGKPKSMPCHACGGLVILCYACLNHIYVVTRKQTRSSVHLLSDRE